MSTLIGKNWIEMESDPQLSIVVTLRVDYAPVNSLVRMTANDEWYRVYWETINGYPVVTSVEKF